MAPRVLVAAALYATGAVSIQIHNSTGDRAEKLQIHNSTGDRAEKLQIHNSTGDRAEKLPKDVYERDLLASAKQGDPSEPFWLSSGDPCQCLNWKDIYEAGLTRCGLGFEFTRAVGYPHPTYGTAREWLIKVQPDSYREFMDSTLYERSICDTFFHKFDDTKCARVAMDSSPSEWYGKNWCYVSKKCSKSMDGHQAGMPKPAGDVGVKFCEEGKDSLLGDMDPVTLIKYGKRMGFLYPDQMVKLAYPLDRSFMFSNQGFKVKELVHKEELQAYRNTGKGYIFDKKGEHLGQTIIMGARTWDLGIDSEDWDTCLECIGDCKEVDLYSFAPKDGLICYQGPKDDMTKLYNNVRQGMNQLMFVNSELWSSSCEKNGFSADLGQTCYGHTFVDKHMEPNELQPHMNDEAFYTSKFKKEHSQEEIHEATAKMECVDCNGNC